MCSDSKPVPWHQPFSSAPVMCSAVKCVSYSESVLVLLEPFSSSKHS